MNSFAPKLRRLRPLLGTFVEIQLDHDDEPHRKAIQDAMTRIVSIHQCMSIHEPDSELSQLNHSVLHRFHPVSNDLMNVLYRGTYWSIQSQGDFDMSILPLLQHYGLAPTHRDNGDFVVGYQWLDCKPRYGVRRRANIRLDAGGIAKGYAVDAAAEVLEELGICNYVVNAGGDLRIGKAPVAVQVRHPLHPHHLIELGTFSQCAVASSACYYVHRNTDKDGRIGELHPLFNPSTGQCTPAHRALSVIHSSTMDADALTKVVAIRGHLADTWLKTHKASAWIMDGASSPCWIGQTYPEIPVS